tara:strand:+ start:24030 stop:24293 length:264 start_codon:yes stop_codon:yes gene_type:complete
MSVESNVKKDVDGKESSKRALGIKLINASLIMAGVYFFIGIGISIFSVEELGYKFPLEIWWTLIGAGSSLLGITLVERFGSVKNKQV